MKLDKDMLEMQRAALHSNPVRAMRARLGYYSRADFARATNCPYSALTRAELGLTNILPHQVALAAERFGEDAAALAGDYVEWKMRLWDAYAKKESRLMRRDSMPNSERPAAAGRKEKQK